MRVETALQRRRRRARPVRRRHRPSAGRVPRRRQRGRASRDRAPGRMRWRRKTTRLNRSLLSRCSWRRWPRRPPAMVERCGPGGGRTSGRPLRRGNVFRRILWRTGEGLERKRPGPKHLKRRRSRRSGRRTPTRLPGGSTTGTGMSLRGTGLRSSAKRRRRPPPSGESPRRRSRPRGRG